MATPAEIAAAKEGLTADQLKWLGGADPTDPFIRARGNLPPLPSQTTIPSKTEIEKIEKYENLSNDINLSDLEPSKTGIDAGFNNRKNELNNKLRLKNFQPNTDPEITFNNISKDLRVKIRIPSLYYTSVISDNRIQKLTAIIFPYTPVISYESAAEYSSINPVHSNFSVNFYKNSTVKSIQISGKFTVENNDDAEMYLSTVNLIKSLLKMRTNTDVNAGSPPPVCRLDGYGDSMLSNVPIAITSFRVELADDVDYFAFTSKTFGTNSVPTRSTLTISCLLMYSRNEIRNFSVQSYLNNKLQSKGYL